MEVILREEVHGLGKAGELVKVREGYARNYLLPQKKAVLADPKNVKQLEHQKRMAEASEKKIKKAAEEAANKLSSISVTIEREAGEEDKLFGSVSGKDIADALRKQGATIDKRQIQLAEPIKQIGEYSVNIKLHSEVTAAVKVWVVKKA